MAIKNTGNVLKRLRSLMKNSSYVSDSIHAYIVPSADAHGSEYIASCDARRAFISGFDGSAGTAIITSKDALLWTDGRYFLQAEKQLDHNWTLMKDAIPGTPTQAEWLCKNLSPGSRVGVDPFVISFETWRQLANQLDSAGHTLVPINDNLVDEVWDNRPPPPNKSVEPLQLVFTGKSWIEKIVEIRQEMVAKETTALILTALDEIAWLFNLRGSDIDFNPVFFAYSVITIDNIYLFIDENKLSPEASKHLHIDVSAINHQTHGSNIELRPYKMIKEFLKWMISQIQGKIWISQKSSCSLVSLVPESRRVDSLSPIQLKKAIKNSVEIEGMKRAHIKDAVALCEFFAWLEEEVSNGDVDEISAANKLEQFRREQEDFVGLSFETISASGPNAAIIHYRSTEETNRQITKDEIYLCDSGAQYKDGTTDVTRTIHLGTPSSFEKECFTRVFKGHIALATSTFPQLVKGNVLDTCARKALWDVGLDYLHGTGHGVGMFLNVHEGPMGISYRPYPDDPGLVEGMILSNEPGFYEDDKFGIRIENLVLIKKANTKYNYRNRGYLTFETITLVPIQTKLLEPSLLTSEEIVWLDNYHQTCRDIVGKALEEQGKGSALQWLLRETQSLG
ncbi:xaa-Pro aminopeptidase 1-like [Oppia nitens]|uniref:xaa-Pro aminopeptidase 1-like n=1 Tax=Oppia nitens TaxID=1686743 RepID=UPI0023DCC89F|nr:xaa-Pro aminopeptidase 1-like [Oppia nitens]